MQVGNRLRSEQEKINLGNISQLAYSPPEIGFRENSGTKG